MKFYNLKKIAWICLLLLNRGTTLRAEIEFNYPAHFANLNTGFIFRTWTIHDSVKSYRVSQAAFPLTAVSPLSQKLNLMFSTSHSTSLLNRNLDTNLQGIVDGKLKLFYQMIPNHLMLNAGISLPYGKNRLTNKETSVAEVLYENILGFGVTRFGEGLDFEGGIATAFQANRALTVGVGLGYLAKGKYRFLDQSTVAFQPGNEFSANMGLDLNSDSLFVRTDFLFKQYTTDKLDGKSYLKQGVQLELTSRLGWRIYPIRIDLMIKHVYKDQNIFYGSLNTLLTEGLNFIDHSTWGKAALVYQKNSQLAFHTKFGISRFGQSDVQWDEALIFSGGFGVVKKISEYFIFRNELQYLNGNAVNNTIKMNGWDFNMTLMLRL